MFFIIFALWIALADGQSNERIHPLNTVVIAGKQFSLVCGKYSDNITSTTQWKVLKVNTFADQVVYNGTHLSNGVGEFDVHSTSDGISSLNKRSSSMNDAGTYKCIQKIGKHFVVSSAQVIVFATDPVCKPKEARVIVAQYLEINCSVIYAGSISLLSPVMKWSKADGIDSYIDADYTTIIAGNSSMISTLKRNATKRDNNVAFQCITYFNQTLISNEDKTGVRKAINAPTYEHRCTTIISVLFEPEAADINPKKDVYTLGDVLLCKADGNPTPTYEWTELGSNRIVSNEASLTVDSIEMQNHAYKCTATSTVAGNQNSISTTVTILAVILPPTGRTNTIWYITIVACIILGLLIVMMFAASNKRFKFLESINFFTTREGNNGPDIVQNADEIENERFVVEENGYAEPEHLGLRAPPIQPRSFAVEARDEEAFVRQNERQPNPVYSEVHKKSTAVAGNPSGVEIPVYGKVQKNREDIAACSDGPSLASTADNREVRHGSNSVPNVPALPKKQNIGTDGTQYMDVADVRGLAIPSLPPRPPLFERSQYAEIVHTKPFPK